MRSWRKLPAASLSLSPPSSSSSSSISTFSRSRPSLSPSLSPSAVFLLSCSRLLPSRTLAQLLSPRLPLPSSARTMSSSSSSSASPAATAADPTAATFFGPFDVSTQVFYATPLSFAIVNLKPLLPGHVLVCPRRPHRRLTDLDRDELADLFGAVQTVQRMLAAYFFTGGSARNAGNASSTGNTGADITAGSFNLAIQDGPEAGQTVSHVHVHVIPRIRGATAKDAATEGDALYGQMAAEPGNVGGAQWDAAVAVSVASSSSALGQRPRPGGQFPQIEDSSRKPRPMAEMEAEAAAFRQALARLEQEDGGRR